jgi:transmembrane sensor
MIDRRSEDYKDPIEPSIRMEAADWLVRLADDDFDPEEPYPNAVARNNAFLRWVSQSPAHLAAFLDVYETRQRLYNIDRDHVLKIEEVLKQRDAGVIHLYSGTKPGGSVAPSRVRSRRRVLWLAAAASIAAMAVSSSLVWDRLTTQVYSTGIGDQRTAKLDDGSFVTLNTNSQIEVSFTSHARNIRLMRGEAYFVVEHDTTRPFWVHAGSAAVRAVGTQFSVRRRTESTDVSVLEGVVQVTASNDDAAADEGARSPTNTADKSVHSAPTQPLRLAAGEEANVTAGHVAKVANPSVTTSTAWRQRRLIFHDAPLSDIADEFNRYNKTQVIVEGPARARRLSGIFDADHPEALVLYAAKDDSLAVQPEGDNWLIRSH